jgi:hypothetical protein
MSRTALNQLARRLQAVNGERDQLLRELANSD